MSALHALLIGIDDYVPGRLPDGTQYPSLHGTTRDVERMEAFLRDRTGLTPERTCKLLSRVGEDGRPTAPPDLRPTYANIVSAFKRLATEAAPGDLVYVHYSGHGARLATEYEKIKGPGAQDEALVPCDIGEPGSRYLRDLELAVLVRLLVDQGLLVTLVLDSCHSGGAMRTGTPEGAVARQVTGVRLPPVPSAVAQSDLLMRAWRQLQQEDVARRNLSAQSWMPVARYVLFAACRPDELAYEYPFVKDEPQGALTYGLLDALQPKKGLEQSCDEIQKKLVANIRGTLKNQTPMLIGDGDRLFLGEAPVRRLRLSAPDGPMVLRVAEDGRVLLGWGQAQWARTKNRLVLKSGRQRAVLEVRQVGSSESWAEVVHGHKPSSIPPGSSVEVLPLQAVVRLLPPEPADAAAKAALEQLREALWNYRGGFVEVDDETDTPDLCVAFVRGAFEIRDPDGSIFQNLAPLPAGRGVVGEVVRRLDHLAKFRSLRTVENPQPPDWLQIGLELCGDDPSAVPEPFPAGGIDLRCAEQVRLRIVNRSDLRLDFAVLDLAPDYSVTQIVPSRKTLSLLPLDPGEEQILPILASLPKELPEGVDILKIFATRGAVSYRWMELPPLGKPDPSRTMRGGLTPSKVPEEEWISAQVEIRVRR
jgi:Caspase domain